MNRTLDQAAAVLGIKPRTLRQQLRQRGVLKQTGELACQYIGKGHLFIDTRSRWNPNINAYTHYGVVMATEAGIGWLAKQFGIQVTNMSNGAAA